MGCGSTPKRRGCTLARPPVSRMPSTASSSAPISVIVAQPANIIGSAPATSAIARRLVSPHICTVNRFSISRVLPITPMSGPFHRPASHLPQVREGVVEPPERIIEDRARRREVEAQPGFAARPELLTRARIDARAFGNPRRDVLGLQAGAREIDPGKIGAAEPHRARAGRRRFDPLVEEIAAFAQIHQQRVEPCVAGAPRRLGRDHAEAVVGAKPARIDPRVELLLQCRVRGDAGADMGAGEIEGLGRGQTSDQAVGDLRRGGRSSACA